LERWLDVDLSIVNACGIHEEEVSGQGSLWCWGAGGTLFPVGIPSAVTRPRRIGTASNWVEISMGEDTDGHHCARNALNEGYCWGDNSFAQVSGDGQPTTTAVRAPMRVDEPTGWKSLVAGNRFSCGINGADALRCFGERSAGKLGDGRDSTSSQFVDVDSALSWSALSAGQGGTCALDSTGALYCWGDVPGIDADADGGLVLGTLPVRVVGMNPWSQVSRSPADSPYACGVQIDGSAWCWGTNAFGRLGGGATTTGAEMPARVGAPGMLESDWLNVQTAQSWTVGIRSDGGDQTLWWWGQVSGGLGLNAPAQATPLTGWSVVAPSPTAAFNPGGSGQGHLCGVRNAGPSGTVWCWGAGLGGQLGDGAATNRSEPVQVTSPSSGWFDVASGDAHTCALRENGPDRELWCWGQYGGSGDLSAPQQLERVDWRQIDADAGVACGVTENGSVWAWGGAGVLGGAASGQPLLLGTGFESVSCSNAHLCATNAEGRARCLGSDRSGELGVGGSFGPAVVELPTP
ncbi:MAG: hypothetical protein AAF658_06665, partial [Myxococcota bacterium]